jgi:hypothetical protein
MKRTQSRLTIWTIGAGLAALFGNALGLALWPADVSTYAVIALWLLMTVLARILEELIDIKTDVATIREHFETRDGQDPSSERVSQVN